MTKTEALSQHSHYVENTLRHVFLSDLCRALWRRDHTQRLHIYNNEVDDAGFDLVIGLGSIVRHVQLKARNTTGRARSISAHTALASAQGGCIVWMFFSTDTLTIEHYRFFGQPSGEAMSDISHLPEVLTQRRNIRGQRTVRPHHRTVRRSDFSQPLSTEELIDALFQ